jgi:hypothetical protein
MRIVFAFCLLPFAFSSFGCGSIPNLESAECTAARNSARQFYSFHFANNMVPSVETFKAREQFLTPRFNAALAAALPSDLDPFTMSVDLPRTFKIAECTESSPTNVDLKIQTYWRDDASTRQQEVHANFVNVSGKWLLDSVGSKGR